MLFGDREGRQQAGNADYGTAIAAGRQMVLIVRRLYTAAGQQVLTQFGLFSYCALPSSLHQTACRH